jgi:D-alanyl-D-alanine carboxypeptidase
MAVRICCAVVFTMLLNMNYYKYIDGEYFEGTSVNVRTRRRNRKKKRLRVLTFITIIIAMIACSAILIPHILPDSLASLQKTPSSTVKESGTAQPTIESINKGDYTTVNKTKKDIHIGNLILVNNQHAYEFPDTSKVVSVYEHKNKSYKVKNVNLALTKNVISELNKMMAEFYEQYGNGSVNIISGYRTLEYQQGLLDDKVHETGEAEALRWIARPGYSEHHTGLAFDLGLYSDAGVSTGFTGTGTFKWLDDNFYRYGFIVRYPEDKTEITGISFEPWHIRYVGRPHAEIMKQNNFCFEEYMDYLMDFEFSKHHLIFSSGDTEYEIYYTKSLKVAVPKEGTYDISGNNIDGFIVTAHK